MTKKILVVDDEEDIRETLSQILKSNKFNVVTAKDADDCLKKVKSEKPDLILLDIMMPGTPVKDVINKIKSVNIIFVSVLRVSDVEKAELIKDNVKDFIEKPFNIDDIIKKVKENS